MARKNRSEIVICVVTRGDLIKFFAYDIVLSSALYAGLKKFHLHEWVAMAGSSLFPVVMRETFHRHPRRGRKDERRRMHAGQPLVLARQDSAPGPA